jgi:hypothetical protein
LAKYAGDLRASYAFIVLQGWMIVSLVIILLRKSRAATDSITLRWLQEDEVMDYQISKVEYFHTTVADQPGEAYKFLSQLAGLGINLLAFAAVPVGPSITQLTIFPEDSAKLRHEAGRLGVYVDGPHKAFLVRGDDELGVLAEIHRKIYEVGVNVHSASGVTDGRGSFGYIVYLKSDKFEQAAAALGL